MPDNKYSPLFIKKYFEYYLKNYLVSAKIAIPVVNVSNKEEAENIVRKYFDKHVHRLNLDIYRVDDFVDITVDAESAKSITRIQKI